MNNPITLRDTMIATEVQYYLFCLNSLLSNTAIDVTLKLTKNGDNRILDYAVEIGTPRISNESLAEVVTKNFQSEFIARVLKKDYYHSGILLVTNRSTAQELQKVNNGQFAGKIISLEEKSTWYSLEGRNKLTSLIQKAEIPPHLMKIIQTYIRAEAEHFKAFVGLAHIVPWLVSRLNNNNALQQQLSKLPRWY